MPLWRIRPVVHPSDSRWQERRVWAEVIVRAPSAAFARLAASKLDEPPKRRRLGNETHCFRSGFEDEKLYWVRQVSSEEAADYKNVEPVDCVIVAVPLSDEAEDAAGRPSGGTGCHSSGVLGRVRTNKAAAARTAAWAARTG